MAILTTMLCLVASVAHGQPAPASLVAVPGDAQVTLSWPAVAGTSGYNVKQTARSSRPATVIASNIMQTSLIATNLRNNQTYYYTVSSVAGDFESVDLPRLAVRPSAPFLDILPAGAELEKLATGFQYTEGPLWVSDNGGYVIFCDVGGDRLLRWAPAHDVAIFRQPSHKASGNALDADGRLITAEHTSRRVTRTEADGTVEALVTEYDGKPFNEPNDLAVKSDGTIWFTDPAYINSPTQPGQWVYRFQPELGDSSVTLVAKDVSQANGICFSPDETHLYVADYGSGVRQYEVLADGSLGNSTWFTQLSPADGIKVDRGGRLWVSAAGNGLRVFDAIGSSLGTLSVPEAVANLCFGGIDQEMLFITASSSLYGITRLPDLMVEAISAFPAVPSVGQPVKFTATVKNRGTGAILSGTPIRVAFSIGGETNVVWSDSFSGDLPPNAAVVLTADSGVSGPLWFAREGTHSIYATIDDQGHVFESLENNNTLSRNIIVAEESPDSDGDGMVDRDEFTAGTDPQSAESALRVLACEMLESGTIALTWSSVPGKRYRVAAQSSVSAPDWISFSSEIVATESSASWRGTRPLAEESTFFRIAVMP